MVEGVEDNETRWETSACESSGRRIIWSYGSRWARFGRDETGSIRSDCDLEYYVQRFTVSMDWLLYLGSMPYGKVSEGIGKFSRAY